MRIILSLAVILCWPSFYRTAHAMHTIKIDKKGDFKEEEEDEKEKHNNDDIVV